MSAYYLLSWSWGGASGTMAGCQSSFTSGFPNFWGQGTAGQLQSGASACSPNPCLRGYWTDKLGPYLTFAATPSSPQMTKTVSEPAPGKSTTVESPSVPKACTASSARTVASSREAQRCEVTVKGNAGGGELNFDIKWIATAGEGDLLKASPGEFVFWCWLDYDFVQKDGTVAKLSATQQLLACVNLAGELVRRGKLGSPKRLPARGSAAVSAETARAGAGCKTKAIPIALRARGRKLVVAGRAKKAKLPAGSTRYQCSFRDGRATLTVTAPRGLRKAVGKTLSLGVYKQNKAPRTKAKLSVTFGWK